MGRRILLLNEDFSENSRIEGLLKKIGFDTSTLGGEVGLTEQILGFRPELIVVSGQSAKLSAISVGAKLKEMRAFTGLVILGFPKDGRLSTPELLKTKVDRILDTPFDVEALIRAICELLNLDADSHVEKLRKFTMVISGSESQSGRAYHDRASASVVKITSKLTSAEREARFSKYVTERSALPLDKNVSDTTFNRVEVRDKWAEVKKDWDPQKLAEQDALKRDFTRALFGTSEGHVDVTAASEIAPETDAKPEDNKN